jgi:hypothetical protein
VGTLSRNAKSILMVGSLGAMTEISKSHQSEHTEIEIGNSVIATAGIKDMFCL